MDEPVSESRKQFEEWARTVGLDLGLVEDSYFSSFTYYASLAWKASRALAMEEARKLADVLKELLNDTQHLKHKSCAKGYCPVRDAREALEAFDAIRKEDGK